MFNDINTVIRYIESKANKKSFEAYQDILNRHNIHLNTKKIIHVTGTNGKGSTVHYLSQFLMEAGYKVGTFTSPYLISYHDRFCINGKPISDERLIELVNENYELIEKEQLSKFEIDVLLMIQYFNTSSLDYAIVEVGVGGKEDKTNVVDSHVQCIVNIGKDHMPRLGTTELEVCKQKAGIIKENGEVFTCVIQDDCLDEIKKVADNLHCNLHVIGQVADFNYGRLPIYQHLNITLAYEIFKNVCEKDIDYQKVIDTTSWAGRFERFQDDNTQIIIDGAHNEHGIHALIEALKVEPIKYTVIFSALRDKDYTNMIHMLEEHYKVYVTVFEDERKMTEEDLSIFNNVCLNFEEALEKAKENDHVVITGSLHFISFVRKYLIDHGAIISR